MPVGMDEQCRVYNEDLLGEIMTGEGKRLEDTGVPLSEEDLTYTMQLQAAQTRGPRSPARTPASRGTNMSRGTNKLSALVNTILILLIFNYLEAPAESPLLGIEG